jgi:hypothetical protein
LTVHQHRPTPIVSRKAARVLAVLTAVVVVGCGGGGGPTPTGASPTPGSTSPAGSPGGTLPTPSATTDPIAAPWPAGWDSAFCTLFGELVVMQELAVDIGRALDDGDRGDARGLTAELAASATTARELLAEVPEWLTAEPLREDVTSLLALADEMALRYDLHLNQGRRPALARARAAGAQMAGVVEPMLERLELLADQGLACPGLSFDLETPPEQ